MGRLKRIRLLHCGDLHLDAPFTSLADRAGLPDQRRQELKHMLGAIVDLAASEQVDLLLICGDLYEQDYIKNSTFHFICDRLQKIKTIPVLIIPGNHDPASSDSLYSGRKWPENVKILKSNGDLYVHPATGTHVYGGLPGHALPKKPADRHEISILMLHGTLDMPFSPDAFHPVSSAELESLGFDYYALGHFHTVINGAGRSKRIYNAGSPEPLGFDEEGDHGVFIVSIEKEEGKESLVDVSFRKLGGRHFLNLEVQAGGCLTDEQAAAAVASAVEKAGGKEDLFRVTLKGYVNRSYRADTAYIAGLLKDRCGYIRIYDNTVPDYDFDLIAREPGLRGLFVRKMLDRAGKAPDEESRQLVLRALYYGMEAIDEGSVCV